MPKSDGCFQMSAYNKYSIEKDATLDYVIVKSFVIECETLLVTTSDQ